MIDPELDTSVVEEQETITDETVSEDDPDGGTNAGEGGGEATGATQQAASELQWWETPEGQAYLENLRNQERQQARLEVETEVSIRTEQERLSQLSDEEFGAYVRQTQEQANAFSGVQRQVAGQFAQKVWEDLCATPDFHLLTREEQAEVYYRPTGGNPFVAAANKIAEKRAEQLAQQKIAELRGNVETATAQEGAPPVGATVPSGVGAIPADWDDLWAERDRKRGIRHD